MVRVSFPLRRLLFALVLLVSIVQAAVTQGAPDPVRAALATAVQDATLESAGTPPFRLEATYQTFDYLGEPVGSGTLTEEFLRPGLHKLTVREGDSSEKYAPEDQAKIGDPQPGSSGNFMQRLLVELLLHPGPSKEDLESAPLKEKDTKYATVTLRCITVQLTGKSPRGFQAPPQIFCLSSDAPMLRLSVQRYGLEALYNRMAKFGSHTFAQDIAIRQGGKVRGQLKVTRLVSAPGLKEADFPDPSKEPERIDADKLRGAAKIASGVAAGAIITKTQPVYPMLAKAKHISGAVILHAVISKEGTIEALDVISAPSEDLAESAVDAVSTWRYKPYLLNGKPTEVDTTVMVNFSFGG